MPIKGSPYMSILNTISLESNKKIKINFNGGNLSLLYTGIISPLLKVPKIIF